MDGLTTCVGVRYSPKMLPDDYNEIATKNPRYENIAGQGFHTDPLRINRAGKAKGTRNRATIVREAIEAIRAGSGQMVVDELTAAQIEKALTGDTTAYKELMDSAYGKLTDKSQVEMAATVSRVERTVIDPKNDNPQD